MNLICRLDQSRFKLFDADLETALKHNPMFEESVRRPSFYDKFETDFKKEGLSYAVTHSPGYRIYKKAALKNRLLQLSGKK